MNKKLTILSLLLLLFVTNQAADVITLNNQMSFSGKVKKIKDCQVKFKTAGEVFFIPAEDIHSVVFENPNNRVFRAYQELSDSEKCMKARSDADLYHGKTGFHVAMGVLFGPFAIIGAAVANPTPEKGNDTYVMSKNRENFSDATYLSCYKKKA
ncbi:MAG: hypothetical protein ACQESQ_12365, partial [Bacteroidota bacterium]